MKSRSARDRAGIGERNGRRLADQGLLAYERYHGVKLTESGRRAALRTLKTSSRHRSVSLAGAGISVGSRAPRGRAIGARGIGRAGGQDGGDHWRAGSGSHGAPIPTRDGSVDETEYTSLAQARSRSVRRRGESVGRRSRDVEISCRAVDSAGKEITVKSRRALRWPITLFRGTTGAIHRTCARANVLVEPLADRGGKRG